MSGSSSTNRGRTEQAHAPVFAALGDATRLSLVARLREGSPLSISQLTERSNLTRQGISKHLRVLQNAGIVQNVRAGRESRYEYRPEPLQDLQKYLEHVSQQWDERLGRLKSFVEG